VSSKEDNLNNEI